MATINATPAKLKNGTWGAYAKGKAAQGDTLKITTSTGKSWDATVVAVLWSGEGKTLCETRSLDAAPAKSSGRGGSARKGTWTGCSCGSVEEYERANDCASCRHDRD